MLLLFIHAAPSPPFQTSSFIWERSDVMLCAVFVSVVRHMKGLCVQRCQKRGRALLFLTSFSHMLHWLEVHSKNKRQLWPFFVFFLLERHLNLGSPSIFEAFWPPCAFKEDIMLFVFLPQRVSPMNFCQIRGSHNESRRIFSLALFSQSVLEQMWKKQYYKLQTWTEKVMVFKPLTFCHIHHIVLFCNWHC